MILLFIRTLYLAFSAYNPYESLIFEMQPVTVFDCANRDSNSRHDTCWCNTSQHQILSLSLFLRRKRNYQKQLYILPLQNRSVIDYYYSISLFYGRSRCHDDSTVNFKLSGQTCVIFIIIIMAKSFIMVKLF